MSFSDKDYKKMAEAIVSDYMSGDLSLQKGVTKVADDTGMNPHETKRLVEATNVKAHLDLFEKQADDKIVEFNTVDPDEVLNDLFASKENLAKTASVDGGVTSVTRPIDKNTDFYGQLDDEKTPTKKQHKVAELTTPDIEEQKPDDEGIRDYKKRAKLAAIENKLTDKAHFAIQDYYEGIEKFAQQFKKLYGPDFQTFQKEAQIQYGKDAHHPLRLMGEVLGEEVDYREKQASEWKVKNEQMKEFENLIGMCKEALDKAKSVEWFREKKERIL